jgi:alanine racemase
VTRPTRVYIDDTALVHNVRQVSNYASGKPIIAMVKANAYGCGIAAVAPIIASLVDAFGVACLEEALEIRKLGIDKDCILFQGVFSPEELSEAIKLNMQLVLHQPEQLEWLTHARLPNPIKVWIKVNTGMHRLGFMPDEVPGVYDTLSKLDWVNKDIGIMTHIACADEPAHPANTLQLKRFKSITNKYPKLKTSVANSAAIISLPELHGDVVRPGIMLYGVSPFADKAGIDIGLRPVMQFVSRISAIHHYPAHSPVGYGATWQSDKPSIIGIVPVGYGDGYPRHIHQAHVWVNGVEAPIVGRVSMDMLTIDLTQYPDISVGDSVELWGKHIPVERIAASAGTIGYELICQVAPRVRQGH